MEYLILDIETRPDPMLETDPVWWQRKRDTVEPDGRLKDPLKIAADIESKLQDQRDRMALSPVTGIVACIGLQWYELDTPRVFTVDELSRDGERRLLHEFSQFLSGDTLGIIGWNVREFDIPFLCGRAMISGIGLRGLPMPRDWQRVVDLKRDFNFSDSLDSWQYVAGQGFKPQTGEELLKLSLLELAEHCKQDIDNTAALARRLEWAWMRKGGRE